jgi:endonuclease-3
MEVKRASKILETLLKTFKLPEWMSSPCRRPFETLIRTIISQNTSNKNTARAFKNILEKFSMTPEAFSNAELSEIEQCLKPAGLYRNKSKIIKKLSRIIIKEFNGSLEQVLSLPTKEARKVLLGLPGIGRKTADILLLFCAKKPTVPVDTHVNRVSRRLGLAPANGGYEEICLALQKLYDPKDYLAIHVLLILLGRNYCKARKPLCNMCPVDNLCLRINVED